MSYRAMAVLGFVLAPLALGILFGSLRIQADTLAKLAAVEARMEQSERKNAVRDQWMREHQGELMVKIETRLEQER